MCAPHIGSHFSPINLPSPLSGRIWLSHDTRSIFLNPSFHNWTLILDSERLIRRQKQSKHGNEPWNLIAANYTDQIILISIIICKQQANKFNVWNLYRVNNIDLIYLIIAHSTSSTFHSSVIIWRKLSDVMQIDRDKIIYIFLRESKNVWRHWIQKIIYRNLKHLSRERNSNCLNRKLQA